VRFELRERFALELWQQEAVSAWLESEDPSLGPRHGILDIYTGAGKTVVALGAMAAVSAEAPGTKFAVVVPTIALAEQWVTAFHERTSLPGARVGMVGGEHSETFSRKDVLIYVLASARGRGQRSRLAKDAESHEVMLVVDECHKAGAPSSSRIFDAATTYRLGLSATPLREGADSQDDLGQVLPLERQRHGRALGGVCYRLGLRDGYERGMLPRYEIHHHGISLTREEQEEYSLLTHRVSEARKGVTRCGGSPEAYLSYLTGRAFNVTAALRSAAAHLQTLYLERKSFLYRASERGRVVERILVQSWQDERLGPPRGAVLFNERIGDESSAEDLPAENPPTKSLASGAEDLTRRVKALAASGALPFSPEAVALEHSRKSAAERKAALAGLRAGTIQVLVSVKALQEGIDIPDVGLGVSVASTASARQRIQTMGRVLRPARDPLGRRLPPSEAPVKRLHLLYVRGTVDEEIYKRTDWNDETGADRNHWWSWDLAGEEPAEGERLTPTDVDETTAWERIADEELPQPWAGPTNVLPLVHKQGSVFVVTGAEPLPVSGAEDMIALLAAGKARGAYPDARGGFKVTPALNVVLKRGISSDASAPQWLALGRLAEAPTWSAPAAEAAAPSASSPEDSKRPAKTSSPKASARGGKTAWFVLVQEGFLAATQDDRPGLEEATQGLRGATKPWAYAAMSALAEGRASSEGLAERAPSKLDELLPYVALAYTSGRSDLVERAAEGFRVGKAKKDKRVAVHNALAILAGRTQEIWRPD
jgi:superfamily II DNA or RNA helicase